MVVGGEDYYCRISFYLAILQGIVGPDCMLWNYEFRWAENLHDWAIFQVTKIRRAYIEGKYQPYKLVGDVAYPMRPWMYYPFNLGRLYCPGKRQTEMSYSLQLECVQKKHLVY